MKLSFVTPRYGRDIVGGAEHAVALLAQNCQKYGGVDVEVLTTTAGDERTWSAKYDSGHDVIDGIDVFRYRNDPIDRQKFDAWAAPLLEAPRDVTSEQFDQWLRSQGPYSPDLLDAIEGCASDAIVFHPMLSSPTSHGVFRAKVPVVIHPALHDEPLSFMPGYKEVIERADLLAFSTYSEQALSHRIHESQLFHQSVIGFGIDQPRAATEEEINRTFSAYGLESNTYGVVIGRVDAGKGAVVCAEMFAASTANARGIDKLVFIGPLSEGARVDHDDIIYTGALSDADKWALLSRARVLVSPSVTESFSLVVLEAMAMGVPVVVNGKCEPTREHVERSGSGAWFQTYAEFVSAVYGCSSDSDFRRSSIRSGEEYVKEYYSWETLIPRYLQTVERCISRSTSS